jgi:hypothetical protein
MTLFTFRGVKSHEWTFYDPFKLDETFYEVIKIDDFAKSHQCAL